MHAAARGLKPDRDLPVSCWHNAAGRPGLLRDALLVRLRGRPQLARHAREVARIEKAFRGFDVAKVARFGEADVDRLLADAAIVRNGKKIVGTIENAREVQWIARDDGGMTAWIRSYRGDGDALIKAVKKRFHHMGDVTSRMSLTCVGAIEYQTWEPTARQRSGKA